MSLPIIFNDHHDVDGFLAIVSSHNPKPDVSRKQGESHTEWGGTATYEEAIKLARFGWQEGSDRLKTISAEIEERVSQRMERPCFVADVAGACPDVGRFVQGLPDNMQSFATEEIAAHGKIVRVVVNISASGCVSPQVIAMRGAAICALIAALHERGMSVEVEALQCVRSHRGEPKGYGLESIMLKKPTDLLEIDRLAFMLAHPSMLRRLIFDYEERKPANIRRAFGFYNNKGYGMPSEAPEGYDRGDIYLPQADWSEQWQSLEAATAWVIECLKSQGVCMA